jgi:Ca2+-dependent lipid-binding protein
MMVLKVMKLHFTFRATDDNNNQSSIATVTITVTGVNDMPTVSAITKTVDENSTTEIILSGNDPEGTATLVYSLVTSQPVMVLLHLILLQG